MDTIEPNAILHTNRSKESHGQSGEPKGALSVYAVGDVGVNRDDPESIFAFTASVLNGADIAFCQLESLFSERGSMQAHATVSMRAHPNNVRALKYAGFQVVSCAGNHCMDWGAEALFDTIDVLKQNGIYVLGVGRNITEARKPVIVERKGTRVGFLAYNSILPTGYRAEADRPGCAPLRAYTLYEPVEPDQPGTPCRIRSFANRQDLEAMLEDIKRLRAEVDVLVLSLHWGLHFMPAALADYQKEVGHAAIDAGADLILGHHAHILKGIEVYKGKVVFYSLCNFGLESPPAPREYFETARFKERQKLYNPDWKYDPEYASHYFFPPDSRKTILVKILIADKQIQKVSFLPAYINPQAQPNVFPQVHKMGQEVFSYMESLCQEMGTKLSWEGDEVLISARR